MKKLIIFILFLIMITRCTAKADTLSWDPNPDASSYSVFSKVDGEADSLFKLVSAGVTVTNLVIPPGEFNKTYVYVVKAYNACGNSSDFSDPVKYNKCLTSVVSKVLNCKIVIAPKGN